MRPAVPRPATGITLIELLVALAVFAILVTVAVPGFQRIIEGNRATATTNELVSALALGRSEATRRGAAVTLCPSTDQAACSGGNDWAEGWIIVAADGAVIRAWQALGGRSTLSGPESIVFIGDGSVNPPPVEAFCLVVSPRQRRLVEVNQVGRVRSERNGC